MDIVGLGALNLDIIYRLNFDVLPQIEKGTERRVNFRQFRRIKKILEEKGKLLIKSGGGSAANTIYALARMGFSCGFVGKVGKDKEGDFLLQELRGAGVDTSRIKREGKSGICLILVDEKGERSTLVLPNTNDALRMKDIDMDYIREAKILHTSSFLGKRSFYTQKKIILGSQTILSFDPGHPHVLRGWKTILPLLKKTYVLFSTQREIELLTGKNFKQGSYAILQEGVKVVVCKMGGGGSWVISSQGEWFIPVYPVKAVDTTGAGDVYAAGFLGGILKGFSLHQCGKIATRAAALSVTGWGRSCYPGEEFFRKFFK